MTELGIRTCLRSTVLGVQLPFPAPINTPINMITDFLSANLEFKVQIRDDEFGDFDFVISLYQYRDAAFSQSISFPCISLEDLNLMIAELEKARDIVATAEKLS